MRVILIAADSESLCRDVSLKPQTKARETFSPHLFTMEDEKLSRGELFLHFLNMRVENRNRQSSLLFSRYKETLDTKSN